MAETLAALIAQMIRTSGPLRLDTYMALCLTHPRHGYYIGRDPLGRAGDFITAPEVSQMFGEMLGLWAFATWQAMGLTGAPRLIELGAGRGTLMADAVRAISQITRDDKPIAIDIVEVSPALRREQERRLTRAGLNARWYSQLDNVPTGPFVLIANEFLDCLPIRQWQVKNGYWHERLVGLGEDGQLIFGLQPFQAAAEMALPPCDGAEEGSVYERSESCHALIHALATRVRVGPGAALIIDYGSRKSGFGDSFQALKAHQYVDPLRDPGTADVTAHVDFEALVMVALKVGAQVSGPFEQGAFLRALGIVERAQRLCANQPEDIGTSIERDLLRLTADDQMGALFKVLVLSSPHCPLPPACDLSNGVH